jgi:phospholipase/carboxylesterase
VTLTGPEVKARSGEADSLVVLLHGYGADGSDLIGLAEPLAPYLPNTRFVAPNAPERCRNNPFGYQWFPIPWLDGSSEAEMRAAASRSFGLLDGWLDRLETPPARTVLVGFSQGTMMMLHVALRRPVAYAGLVGFSGRLLMPETLAGEIRSRPPVLLVHGDQDPMVPFASLREAADALGKAGVAARTHVSPGLGHGIGPDGLRMALDFTREVLAAER